MRLLTHSISLAIGLLACHRVIAWPDPEPFKGTIPHNDREITMDPALMRRGSDDKLFLFTTGKHKGEGYMWTAPSIRGPWTKSAESAFTDEPWNAPYVHYLDGSYYIFYSNQFDYTGAGGVKDPEAAQYWHGSSLSVRSSKTMEPGSWTAGDRLAIPWAKKYNVLDGALVTVGEGPGETREHLLTFGSYQEGLFQIPLADPPTRLKPDSAKHITHLARNSTSGPGLRYPNPTEAGFVFRYGKFYYLFFSSGRCTRERDDKWAGPGEVYKVMVCRSTDPRGGYVDEHGKDCLKDSGGTMILGSHGNVWAPGGQAVMILPEVGGPIIYYHYVPIEPATKKPQRERYNLGWNKLDFGSGWPVLV
ncbi:putative extracellular endo- -alpha-l- protein [Eutypa lata UCREL1]|uniref:Endo-1,5-alpha-L-arabinanase A n=1 Tax=Eutypa lata (strain UCR-EL1) TaxID=1287681 RepID=M7TB96_EUTLA|nr:putative extracellular endo- -alpha-l- protein [Eutypa lata UCREL1]